MIKQWIRDHLDQIMFWGVVLVLVITEVIAWVL